jgi:hypothetical protein
VQVFCIIVAVLVGVVLGFVGCIIALGRAAWSNWK